MSLVSLKMCSFPPKIPPKTAEKLADALIQSFRGIVRCIFVSLTARLDVFLCSQFCAKLG